MQFPKIYQNLQLAAFLLFLSLLLQPSSSQKSYNEPCSFSSPANHCEIKSGLICHPPTSTCQCANGTTELKINDETYAYETEWNGSTCVASIGSLCLLRSPSSSRKELTCISPSACLQLKSLPKGQGICSPLTKQLHSHDSPCSQSSHCDITLGLVCSPTSNKCSCPSGIVLTQKITFNLAWDGEMCSALPGSGCIGTRYTPVADGAKSIKCMGSSSDCIQARDLPPSVGTCQRTVEEQDETTTTEKGGSNGSAGGRVNLLNTVSYISLMSLALKIIIF